MFTDSAGSSRFPGQIRPKLEPYRQQAVLHLHFIGTIDNKTLAFRTKNVERGRLIPGGARSFGTAANYTMIDAGKLSFGGKGAYLVADNKYVFQSAGNAKYGLFFNTTLPRYEFRNAAGKPVFSVNSNNGNGVFAGTLKIGAYTLPSADGTNGQVLTTNGSGAVSWANVAAGNTYTAGAGIAISGNTISNTAPNIPVTLTGSGAATVTGTYPNFTVASTDNDVQTLSLNLCPCHFLSPAVTIVHL
ncbi:MAG TPA: hypothetical protein VFW07_10830 [Parafilimonas sp.]|nr:hypothetical protein [Parafilimonas sp.]